jgi:hypothetical protein
MLEILSIITKSKKKNIAIKIHTSAVILLLDLFCRNPD